MPRTATFSREQVLAAGLEILEADGLAAVTMRSVAAKLGVEAMSLYTYVRNKRDLIAGMAGHVLAGIDQSVDQAGWEAVVDAFAHRYYGALLRYPELIPIVQQVRPTEHLLRGLEVVMAALARAGLREDDQVSALRGLLALCMGHALVDSRPDEHTWEQWPIHDLADATTANLRRAAAAFDNVSAADDFDFMVATCIRGLAALAAAG